MSRHVFPDLSSRQLQAVLALAKYRSFVAAASSLKISQPALTRTIKLIEVELGVPLFSRSTRHVTVTDAGKEFAALAERLLNDLRIGAENVREMGAQPRGQIVVASVVSLAGAVLPGLIADYSRRFPGIELHLREGLHNMVTDEIRNGLADFGIGYVEHAPRSFVTEDLGVETFHLVLRRDDVLARRTRIGLPALTDVPLVSFPPESRTRHVVDRAAAAAAAGLSFRYVTTTNRLPTLHGLVRNRVGLAVVPKSERPSSDDPELTSLSLVGQGTDVPCRDHAAAGSRIERGSRAVSGRRSKLVAGVPARSRSKKSALLFRLGREPLVARMERSAIRDSRRGPDCPGLRSAPSGLRGPCYSCGIARQP
jgi:DNA-binding transcriptional LysR family regulator